jgi:hypothetical protein
MGYIFDGVNKRINLTTGTTTISIRDMWSRWVEWYLIGDNSKFLSAFTQVGGDTIDLSSGTSIPIYIFLQNGWKIKPQESSHTLSVTDGVLIVNGGGDPFVNTTGNFIVRINYSQPVQAITVSTGGGLTVEQNTKLDELWKLSGLKVGSPMIVDDTFNTRTVDDIILDVTESLTSVEVSRR